MLLCWAPIFAEVAGADEAVIGDAWSDPRNPIVQLFGGERLDLWSLKPVKRPDVPDGGSLGLGKARFRSVRSRAIGKRWRVATAGADPRTLVRRLYFDLTGLPPAPPQVVDFEKAVRESGVDDAVAALVDELLASPRYGEHLARLWLDVVRYSDSNGFDWDEFRPQAWRFRDYVVRSFNADKPFDQFIREQLAGDEMFDGPPRTRCRAGSLDRDGLPATRPTRQCGQVV